MFPSHRLFSQAAKTTSTATTATHHLITLLRSPHGLPRPSHATLETLGLHKLNQRVLYPFSPALAGKLLSVKELISVENVTEQQGLRAIESSRNKGEGSGLELSGRKYGGGKGVSSGAAAQGRI